LTVIHHASSSNRRIAGSESPTDVAMVSMATCQAPCDYIPKMSYPLLQAREVLRLLAEEGIEGSVKEAEPRGDGV